ncbi:U2 snRNP-associated SURP domain-containing protein [Perkinsus chesapeaki]|uniref:U2 snRNP-associated SURP domain-containing protein n=1 Tax=Perkinsus chesapeaki TaxID=330153 RepID=A0A7J6LXB4_PERCH|nr:U2 snRNP-associated SURP domain-containing protein [Perkinsus chesapeaki]
MSSSSSSSTAAAAAARRHDRRESTGTREEHHGDRRLSSRGGDEDRRDRHRFRAAVASAAAAAIAAAKNVAKTQEKHELDRRIAVARESAKTAAKKAKSTTSVLPGFATMDDDDEEEEGAVGVSDRYNSYHSGDDSTTSSIPPPHPHPAAAAIGALHSNSKTREMDDFLDEIKSRHQLRHEAEILKDKLNKGCFKGVEEIRVKERLANLQARLGGIATLQESEMIGKAMRGGGMDNDGEYGGDEYDTANLYIGNLPFGVTEDMLIKEFGKYGSITSVKIMYPRTDEERSRGYVPAFIAFANRDEAQAAKDAMESGPCTFGGAMMRETVLRVGWGKAMNSAQVKSVQRNKSMLVQVAAGLQQPKPDKGGAGNNINDMTQRTTTTPTHDIRLQQEEAQHHHQQQQHHASNFSQPKPSLHVNVQLPKSDRQRSLIDKIARLVADNGRNIEQVAIMRVQARYGEKERYNFLFDYDSPEGQYYRWRTFAYAQGDSGLRWRIEPFIMSQANSLCNDPAVLWYPPPCQALGPLNHNKNNAGTTRGNNNADDDEGDDDDIIIMQKCYSVLSAWEQNAIFGPEYLRGLVATLMRTPSREDLDKVKLTEEKDQHFSQLERWCRNNGLLWEYPSYIGNNADDKKEWLLMQIANEKLYSKESGRGVSDDNIENNDEDIDGESVDSDDISIDDEDEDDDEDIDGEALILPGDNIEVIQNISDDDDEGAIDGVPL